MFRRLLWCVGLAAVFVFPEATRGAESSVLADTRAVLDRWVNARQAKAQLETEWAQEKETLLAGIQLFTKELDGLVGKFSTLDEGSAEVARQRTALEQEKEELEVLKAVAQRQAGELESRLRTLTQRLPAILVQRIKPLTDRIPADPGATAASPAERLQTLVGILNEVDKFASSISVESEIRKTPEGSEVEVQTLYLGLSQAFFVGEAGRFAGVGTPGERGWEWTAQNELGSAVQKAIAIYRNQQPAAFVELPLALK